jgi:DNA mismatch repair ATPase MutS
MVENADFEEDPTMKSITFLYTLADGMCDKSYGFYTAKMAGLNVEVGGTMFFFFSIFR